MLKHWVCCQIVRQFGQVATHSDFPGFLYFVDWWTAADVWTKMLPLSTSKTEIAGYAEVIFTTHQTTRCQQQKTSLNLNHRGIFKPQTVT